MLSSYNETLSSFKEQAAIYNECGALYNDLYSLYNDLLRVYWHGKTFKHRDVSSPIRYRYARIEKEEI